MATEPTMKRDSSTSPDLESIEPEHLQPDDWKGLTDPKERRRRQNRVNQRAYRKRKQEQRRNIKIPSSELVKRISSSSENTSPSSNPDTTPTSTSLSIRNAKPSTQPLTLSSRCISLDKASTLLDQLSITAYENYILGSPTSDHLMTLSKMNVFRAFNSIITTLGMQHNMEWLHDDAISPFSTHQPGYVEDPNLPVSLRPTPIQRRISHHPWLDFFPDPRMRDNLVSAGDAFDDEQLCIDIMGFWDMSNESCSLLVWGDPSDPANWEVTEQFLRKWPWVVRGCGGLMEATNRWRASRGEKMIFRYL
ncbi:hypothetical protein P170DRAFT_390734 [Aspergillus steynii IBT 23096]|uniref:BZIP domain-containing protein n=1 Tax=Aspergillus steynii IBT 23096 TaxID=1392250 RepID=A0A2I2FZY5_9EURO|nr:uncharacterized protein P170DRAFT_390734 [Aspergillus steynii IBT 23096]PLB46197.1 hypothetical protein P170DRAFT_390734 [Aspergillus steynii IBT 23096]